MKGGMIFFFTANEHKTLPATRMHIVTSEMPATLKKITIDEDRMICLMNSAIYIFFLRTLFVPILGARYGFTIALV